MKRVTSSIKQDGYLDIGTHDEGMMGNGFSGG